MKRGPSDLVLLFYDGFELRAESAFPQWLVGEARRHARFVWRKLRRRQVRTGYYTAFLNLCLALRRAGLDVRVNDFRTARRFPDHPIGVGGYDTVFSKVEGLPNPRYIGPGPYHAPTQNPTLMEDPRNRYYMQRCAWFKDIFAPYYGEEKLRYWFRGYDLNDFEDVRDLPKAYDVLIYDKMYHDHDRNVARTIAPLVKRLEAMGLTYRIFRYGYYIRDDYLEALRKSRTMAFFAHQETQGHAYQEAMAMNVPIFAWDEGIWLDEQAKLLSDEPIRCTSVPHFDQRCGVTFTADTMLPAFEHFWTERDRYQPRAFVGETLSLGESAAVYMAAYRDAAAPAVEPAPKAA
jgi:hypothetical protein